MEPRWLQERRKEAAETFAGLPIPTQEEFWRRTPFGRVPFEKFESLHSFQNGATQVSGLLPVKLSLSGELLFGEQTSKATLDNACLKQGMKLLSLNQAVLDCEDLVSKYLGKGIKNRHEKFLAQNEAFWQTGVFCYVPQNVSVELPILLTCDFKSPQRAIFPRVLIVLDKGARATFIHYTTSQKETDPNFLNSLVEIYLEEEAKLTFIDLQSLSLNTAEVSQKRIELGRHTTLKWIVDIQGGGISKTNLETVLAGEGAKAEVLGLMCGKQKQHLELCSLTYHTAPHTTADILIKGTADHSAKTIFQGMIRIDKAAQQTESFMANHNLVLSEKAHADSIPRLEIEADDVKASHGATIGQVDPEQLFYLKSRGLNVPSAERLLIEGFYEDIFGRIPVEGVREWMRKNLETKNTYRVQGTAYNVQKDWNLVR